MILDVLRFMEDIIKQGEKAVLVTLISKGGGTPGTTGQVMAVDINGVTKGTVGGGRAEHIIIERSVEAIKNDERYFEFEFELEKQGMICGGAVKGYGTVLGDTNKLIIFGGGHVSQRIYNIAKYTGFNITIVDDREEFKQFFEDTNYVSELKDFKFDKNTYIIICTRGHSQDYTALKQCILEKSAYIGMIGSKSKIKILMDRLKNEGINENEIDKVFAPIGINIDDGTPGEIAVSVMAEILKIKNKGSLQHMKIINSDNII